jgi:hypothetical protein
MDRIVNTRLLMHPVNWLIVWTVAAFALFAYAIAHERLSSLPVSAPTSSPRT